MLKYWKFYWPLALTGVAMVLSVQFQNAALARYPEAITELAIFALGYSTFGFFRASLNFIAQLSNVYARSPVGTSRCHRFVFMASVLIIAVYVICVDIALRAWFPEIHKDIAAYVGLIIHVPMQASIIAKVHLFM